MTKLQYGRRRKEQTHRGKEEDTMRKTTVCAFLCAAAIAGLAAGCGAEPQDTENARTASGEDGAGADRGAAE